MRLSSAAVAGLVAGAALLVSACADARLDKLTLGISQDSAAHAIGQAPHRSVSYLTAGKVWQLQLYDRHDAAAKDSVEWRKMSPVVFIGNKAVGWGWTWWDKEAARLHLPVPPKN